MNLKRLIMRRVYAIWFLRTIWRSPFHKLVWLVLLGWQISQYVSPRLVWQNVGLAGGLTNYRFFVSALAGTEMTVQLSLIAVVLILLWLARDSLFLFQSRF